MARSLTVSLERLNSLVLDAEQEILKKQEILQRGGNTFKLDASIRKKLEVISIELDSLVIAHHKEPSSPAKDTRAEAIKHLEDTLSRLENEAQARPKTSFEISPTRTDLGRASDTELMQMQQKMRERRV